MNQIFDAIIIGGGIMGCSTAYQLARRGIKVLVLEKDQLGTGSTGRSSAIIRQHYSNEMTARMAKCSLEVFQRFKDEIGGDSGFTQTGFLALAPAKDLEGLKANIELQQSVGIHTELLTRDELEHHWPEFFFGELVAAAYEPEAGYADPHLTLHSYADAARRKGAVLLQGTPVTRVNFQGNKVTGVSTLQDDFDAPIVINCAGPWGARIAALAGVTLPINSCRVQVAFFSHPEKYQKTHPVVADFDQAVYWRPETGNLTLVGLIDPSEANAVVDPDHFNERMDFDFASEAGERFARRLPVMEQSTLNGGYAALYAITPDWHPVIDEVPPRSGYFICAGFSGHGFKLGPAVGQMTADMVIGCTSPGLDRTMFRLLRFEENDPVRGRYEYSIAG